MNAQNETNIDALIKEAQTNISWAEHRGDINQKRIWVAKLKELKAKTSKESK